MKILILISIFILKLNAEENVTSRILSLCSNDFDCKNGICYKMTNTSQCKCYRGWQYSKNNLNICDYEQKSKLGAFLLSFFIGGLGADWYYLSAGDSGYIAAGVFKMLTLGGVGIWWIVDWIRILTNSFKDGQGYNLLEWNP